MAEAGRASTMANAMADLLEDGNPWKFHPEKDLRLRHGKPYLYETNDQINSNQHFHINFRWLKK
jgi:hypothetical protein